MVNQAVAVAEERMKKSISVVGNEFTTIRTSRASASLLDRVMVNYYGTRTPLKQLANTTSPEPQLLVVHPYDKSQIAEIEKAILGADLGLTPSNDGNVIRLPFPPLNEERRLELVKVAKRFAEEGRVAIRQIRRDVKEGLEEKEKAGEISEDDLQRAEKELQKVTDVYVEEIDKMLKNKESEIMEV